MTDLYALLFDGSYLLMLALIVAALVYAVFAED